MSLEGGWWSYQGTDVDGQAVNPLPLSYPFGKIKVGGGPVHQKATDRSGASPGARPVRESTAGRYDLKAPIFLLTPNTVAFLSATAGSAMLYL
jgi:hypothetical protein